MRHVSIVGLIASKQATTTGDNTREARGGQKGGGTGAELGGRASSDRVTRGNASKPQGLRHSICGGPTSRNTIRLEPPPFGPAPRVTGHGRTASRSLFHPLSELRGVACRATPRLRPPAPDASDRRSLCRSLLQGSDPADRLGDRLAATAPLSPTSNGTSLADRPSRSPLLCPPGVRHFVALGHRARWMPEPPTRTNRPQFQTTIPRLFHLYD